MGTKQRRTSPNRLDIKDICDNEALTGGAENDAEKDSPTPRTLDFARTRLFRQSEEREPAPKDHLETKDTRENETLIEGAGKRRRSGKANSTRRTLSDSGVRRSGGQSRTI